MKTKVVTVAALAWVAVLYFGYRKALRGAPCAYATALPAQTRLRPSDLACSGEEKTAHFAGRYLRTAESKGDEVRPENLAEMPEIAPAAGTSAVYLSLRGRAPFVRTLNVGSLVDVANGAKILASDAPVIAVPCDDLTDERCSVALSLDAESKTAVQAAPMIQVYLKKR